jgi:hypothetical protein
VWTAASVPVLSSIIDQSLRDGAIKQESTQSMAAKTDQPILDQFLGSDEFPIEWRSEQEKDLFWVFDDLHCPHPLSPMFYEIGGWWLTCDHMFRRFGTPFACDWITKNVNGYLYTAAVLEERPVNAAVRPDDALPADTALWATLQSVSGGLWGGCVYDVDAIRGALADNRLPSSIG